MTPKVSKVETLDRRHVGHTAFTHRAVIVGGYDERLVLFIDMRKWCWENFGPGIERDLVMHTRDAEGAYPYNWGWHVDQHGSGGCYIYLKDATLTAFTLKYCNT